METPDPAGSPLTRLPAGAPPDPDAAPPVPALSPRVRRPMAEHLPKVLIALAAGVSILLLVSLLKSRPSEYEAVNVRGADFDAPPVAREREKSAAPDPQVSSLDVLPKLSVPVADEGFPEPEPEPEPAPAPPARASEPAPAYSPPPPAPQRRVLPRPEFRTRGLPSDRSSSASTSAVLEYPKPAGPDKAAPSSAKPAASSSSGEPERTFRDTTGRTHTR